IQLQHNGTPQIKVINTITETVSNTATPNASNSFEPDIFKGIERKKHMAVIKIPAYRKIGNTVEQLISFDLEVTEYPQRQAAARPNFTSNSVLATGNWYKVSVSERGIFKIDYNFLQSLGLNPANINPNN